MPNVTIRHAALVLPDRIERSPLHVAGGRITAEAPAGAQAIDLRGRPRLGAGTGAAYAGVRRLVPATGRGEAPPQDLEPVRELVRSGELGP